MSHPFVLSLSPFVRLVEETPGEFAFQVRRVRLPVVRPGPGLLSALRQLAGQGATEDALIEQVSSTDSFEDMLKLHYYLDELRNQGWLCHSVWSRGAPLLTCIPISRDHRFEGAPLEPGARLLLSRFACCRREARRMVLESPLGRAQVVLHDWRAMALVARLADPLEPTGLSGLPGISKDAGTMLLQLLLNAGFLTLVRDDGVAEEECDPGLVQWEFHDLFFHSRSREGRHANPYGGTDRFRGKAERPPVVKPKMSAETVDLYRPDLDQLRQNDVPFTRVLEDRRSRRNHGSEIITARQLGEFLYRSARVCEIRQANGMEVSRRVYPGGGASYELELYIVANRCKDLPSGIYQYCPLQHQLCRLSQRATEMQWLLENASYMASSSPPQILIVISARFQRVTWRYGSMAYAAILKDVGVLYQTMYLVAGAMGLAACALGGGHSDMFARAVGTDYYEETSVGEFMLGSAAS